MTDKIGHSHIDHSGSVLAATDASAYSESVAHYAAWAAHRLEAPLEYLHVLDRHPEAASTADFSGNLGRMPSPGCWKGSPCWTRPAASWAKNEAA